MSAELDEFVRRSSGMRSFEEDFLKRQAAETMAANEQFELVVEREERERAGREWKLPEIRDGVAYYAPNLHRGHRCPCGLIVHWPHQVAQITCKCGMKHVRELRDRSCGCGCGQKTKRPGRRFLAGHNMRVKK